MGLDAVLIRGREENKKDPVRWPALCLKDDVAATLGPPGRNVWESLCRKEDDVRQRDHLRVLPRLPATSASSTTSRAS